MPFCSLKDFCFSKDAEKDSDFVGIHFKDGKFKVIFPIGFSPSLSDEALLRKEILLLISTLKKIRPNDKSNKTSEFKEDNLQSFPVSSYLFVFSYFMKNGYYHTKEEFYKKSTTGKISWKRTIRQIKPVLNGENVSYLEFITKRSNYNDDELISIINRFCVYESFEKIGCLFTSFRPKNPHIRCQKKLFSSFLKRKISETFNDDDRELFKNMLAIIKENDTEGKKCEYFYGTNEFHYVWEKLVDLIFGESDKEKFYPKVFWKLKTKSGGEETFDFGMDEKCNSLRPDTIMITNRGMVGQKIFVLDSKYYRYGVTGIKNHLPDSTSIVKQFAYAKYIEENDSIPTDVKQSRTENSIFNAFIMPACTQKIKNIGYASANYIQIAHFAEKTEKSWHKIHGILIDTKTVMEHAFKKDTELIKQLATVIEGNH